MQVTAVGLTAMPNGDGSLPSIDLVTFGACQKDNPAASALDPNVRTDGRTHHSLTHSLRQFWLRTDERPPPGWLAVVCGQSPGTLSKVPLSSIKLPGQHRWLLDKFDEEEDKRRASNPAPAAPAAAAAAAPVTANATTATATAKPNTTVPAPAVTTVEVAPLGTTVVGGQCKAFSDNGHARLVLCVDKPVWDAASGVEITRANLTNNGTVALCNVTMKVGGRTDTRTQGGRQGGADGRVCVGCLWCRQVDGWGKHVHSVWPEWVRDSNWALYFNINQTINIGQSHRHRQKAAARQGGRV